MKAERQPVLLFVGNPNCGKTTLFNAYTGAGRKTANWPGVTVDLAEGRARAGEKPVRLVDLPGVYSLDSYTMEEQVTRRCVEEWTDAVIVNVVSAVSLERNLYLTLQLLRQNRPMVIALNMMDAARQQGISFDLMRLSSMLGGVPVLPVSAKKEEGLETLLNAAIGEDGKCGKTVFSKKEGFPEKEGKSFSAGKRATFSDTLDGDENGGYDYIEEIVKQCCVNRKWEDPKTERLDQLLLHPVGSFCFLGIVLALLFVLTFSVGDWLKGYLEQGFGWLFRGIEFFLQEAGASGWLRSLAVDGVLAGVGGVLVFLPNLLILYAALAALEDSGYLARVAYVMNEIMGKAGLSGRSVIPMLLGFGCTVPAVMAARGLETMEERRRTVFVTPFLSCSARLPIYVLFSGLFFPYHAALAAGLLYLGGILAAILTVRLLALPLHRHAGNFGDRNVGGKELLLELPDYRLPCVRTVALTVWEKACDYLTRAGTTIFLASLVLWLSLHTGPAGWDVSVENSFAALAGRCLEGILAPVGLGNWQLAVALLSGLSAKEVVVSSLAVLFGLEGLASAKDLASLSAGLGSLGFGPANAYAMMVFCLLYTPCAAATAAIARELRSAVWFIAMLAYQLAAAWAAAWLVFRMAGIFL